MKFEEILPLIRQGQKARRLSWQFPQMVVYLVKPGKEVCNNSYLVQQLNNDEIRPYIATQSDLLDSDWQAA